MRKTRILIVDDAVIFRHLMAKVVAADPQLEVADTASDGRIALERLRSGRVDVVSLDIDMPEMDGLETLREIRATHPHLPVLMLSAFEKPGAREIEAMALGANDCVTKVPHAGSTVNAMEWLKAQVLPRLKDLAVNGTASQPVTGPTAASATSQPPATAPSPPVAPIPVRAVTRPVPPASPGPLDRVDVVAIGASTGGPQALEAVLRGLPAPFPVPIVIVQHMPADFTRLMSERLNQLCSIAVAEGSSGTVIGADSAWVAPGNVHMIVERAGPNVILRTLSTPPENSCRPAVDPLFRSVAEVFGARTLGVVLTGMGQDGLRGAEHLKATGAQVIVQDADTSVVWGMPGAVAQAGLADKVLPIQQIANEIVRRVHIGRSPGQASIRATA